jgi:lycopene beta-cyclase
LGVYGFFYRDEICQCLCARSSDYVICGGGMSGLSLAYYLINSKLRNKQILIIEPVERKEQNDRTWAFGKKGANPF